ncbi:MAG: ribonuclease III [Acutalibacteraceae bacterium]
MKTALTHSSYANENKKVLYPSNERLEFLGDSVLGVVVADYLFKHCPNMPEGDLTKKRASLVCEKALCGFATQIGVGNHLLLSNGEKNTGGDTRPSILADAFEAIIAAIYMDGGMEQARSFILRFIEPAIQTPKPKPFKDYKTMLQEIIQQNPEEHLTYVLTGESGPDHNKHFTVEVHLNQNVIGKGGGRSKKMWNNRLKLLEPMINTGYCTFVPHNGCPHHAAGDRCIMGIQEQTVLQRCC